MTQSSYPNVHVRLHLTQHAPDNPPRKHEIEVWLKDSRFRVRELTGRRLDEILADVTVPRQLGAPARKVDDADNRQPGPPTELYGDVETDEGWVYRPNRPRASIRAATLAPVAEQILARGVDSGLVGGRPSVRLGRRSYAYRGEVNVVEDGAQFRNNVVRVISPPYVLLDDAHNARTEQAYVREVLALEEGTVTDDEVTPPAQ